MRPIYLDHNATTPVEPGVLQAMLPYLREEFGNPSSSHELGRRARRAVDYARAEVAALIGASADEIVFTSGGTEASNIAICGAAIVDQRRRRIVTSTLEHPATESCCAALAHDGHEVDRISPGPDGLIDPTRLAGSINEATALVSVIHAQNEIGTIQPVAEIAAIARAGGALVHTDAAQSVGKVPVDVDQLGVDLLSMAGHKLYAPKGIGALYVRRGVRLAPLLHGASQESGRRPGTENVAGIVALGEACRLAAIWLETRPAHLAELSARLWARLRAEIPGVVMVAEAGPRLPNTLNVLFPGVSGRRLLECCPRVQASTGSACHADSEAPSAILTALGLPADRALGAVRLSLGRTTTAEDVDAAAASLAAAWRLIAQPVAAEVSR
jgi:cysteine desulfurase